MTTPAEIHLFAIWPFAMKEREKILADIAKKAQILASFTLDWPRGMSAEEGYRQFYGTLLPDSAGKVKRAGAGPFSVVIVRLQSPRYDWRMTQRGLEFVNLDMFDMKWLYRGWVGGLHRVHGTSMPSEARRDIMTLTGFSADDWLAGRATPPATAALPGRGGWKSLASLFAFLNEVHPYVVLRNGDGLPESFNAEHDDIDMLVANTAECAALIGAKKRPGAGEAAYSVVIAGWNVKLDLRELGDGYYEETWQRRMLANRVANGSTTAKVFVLPPQDTFYALVYHILYMKPEIKADYCTALPRLAATAGATGTTPGEWLEALEAFMAANSYRVTKPRDKSVHLHKFRVTWRDFAEEAAELFSLRDIHPEIGVVRYPILNATMDGRNVRVFCFTGKRWRARCGYDLQLRMNEHSPNLVPRPLLWHLGRGSKVYLVTENSGASQMREFLDIGKRIDSAASAVMAQSALRLVAALDATGIVHRNICAETLRIAPDGALSLDSFENGVLRSDYKAEKAHFRRGLAELLVPLGGDGVARPGIWNDRHALAKALAPFADFPPVAAVIEQLEGEAAKGLGDLRVSRRKLTVRLALLGLEILLRGLVSSRRRKSKKFRRIRAFVKTALFGWKR